MLKLNKDSAPYSELDFPQFNPTGFNRVRQAVEIAQQRRELAASAEDLREATNALRLASDIKNVEQQVAQKNFETEHEMTFVELKGAIKRFEQTHLSAAQRLEIENQLDHLITLFNLKDFNAVRHELGRVTLRFKNRWRKQLQRSDFGQPTKPEPRGDSSLFQRGLTLERAGRKREAIEIYGQVLEHNPRHGQAINRLRQISNVLEIKRKPNQRRGSWGRNYRRYAG